MARTTTCSIKIQPKYWFTWQRSASTWAFFKMNDHNLDVDSFQFQIMKCIMCHNMQQQENNQNFIQSQKGLIKITRTMAQLP
jgi:uncharacterized membrane protein YdbT with pleckstrin-like domain